MTITIGIYLIGIRDIPAVIFRINHAIAILIHSIPIAGITFAITIGISLIRVQIPYAVI